LEKSIIINDDSKKKLGNASSRVPSPCPVKRQILSKGLNSIIEAWVRSSFKFCDFYLKLSNIT
jgi:hypothetical protein